MSLVRMSLNFFSRSFVYINVCYTAVLVDKGFDAFAKSSDLHQPTHHALAGMGVDIALFLKIVSMFKNCSTP